MNELYIASYNNMDESHKQNVEQKKSDTKRYILHNFMNIKFKNR